ncbi:hypothetical protein HK405_004798 [Cladochytrium tenue]|nr:hypothetical protein HK405_008035 [Cladochytrium tenue]KAJ1561144.1 hypothetical protein HK405_004798 [Cladochytrium tenue]
MAPTILTAETVQSILSEVILDRSTPVRDAVDRYFAPGYIQVTDGAVSDREAFITHVEAVRGHIQSGELKVVDFVLDPARGVFADRHVVKVVKNDGNASELDVYMFGRLDGDGRITEVNEITRVISGASGDSELARVRH